MSDVCDNCGSLLNDDGSFCGTCGRVRTSSPARAAWSRPALIPAGAEATREAAYPESRTPATWHTRPGAPGDGPTEALVLTGQAPGEGWAGTPGRGRTTTRLGRIGELGPAWLSALAAVVVALTSAGFFAGRVSATSSHATQPPKITKTAPTAPPVSPGGSASPAALSGAGTAGNGTQLGSYSFQLTETYSAPLGPTAPTQSQIAAGGAYDISYNGSVNSGTNEKMVSLPNGSTPTYSACTTGTLFEESAPTAPGTAFCIIETSGRMAGVTITSVGNSSAYIGLEVTVWKYVP